MTLQAQTYQKIKLSGQAHLTPDQAQAEIEAYMTQQKSVDLLRFMTCGSVDDGKSTLIGRLLWESRQVFEDQLAALEADSRKYGTQGEGIDFALLVDGLTAEREQGITIDVAYRFFSTERRKFIMADTPGHEQYTRNMVTAASAAEAAVILVDARKGILTQTRRHAYLVSLMGIQQVVLAVNKMDLVEYQQTVFESIHRDFLQFSKTLNFKNITAIPLSAQKGANVTQHSVHTRWYSGPTLLGCLETVNVKLPFSDRFVFPVQWVNRPHSDFRGFSGSIVEGEIKVGDEIRVTQSGQTARVSEILAMEGAYANAKRGQAITLTLDQELDISRGDVISLAQSPLEMTDQFEATVIWMSEEKGLIGRNYDLKLATQWASASLTSIKYRIDVNTLAHEAHKQLALNDICVCTLSTSKPVTFDAFSHSSALGAFILVDRFSNATVAAGLIHHSLRRAQNVHRQALSVTRKNREWLNGHPGKVVWFTGYSGSGKSTIANGLEAMLHAEGYRTYLLDGDNIRQGLNKDLGFTDADRVENIRRTAEVAKLMMEAGLLVITSLISPFRQEREMARTLIGAEHFIEVYVNTPLEICESRDPKGLYKKARSGELPNLSGIGSPYEAPENPEVIIEGKSTSIEKAVRQIYDKLIQERELIPA